MFQKIKSDSLEARKNRAKDPVRASLLNTLLSEITTAAKDECREVTEKDVTDTIKAFLKNIKKTLDARPTDATALAEKPILESYLPKGMSDEDLVAVVAGIVQTLGKEKANIGSVMSELRKGHEGLFDGKKASEVIKNALAALKE